MGTLQLIYYIGPEHVQDTEVETSCQYVTLVTPIPPLNMDHDIQMELPDAYHPEAYEILCIYNCDRARDPRSPDVITCQTRT